MNFIDLKSQYYKLKHQIDERINTVLSHGNYIMGPEVQELEQELTLFTGAKHCISCSSGTDALLMALMAKGVGPGDAIFTTTFTFIATAEVISFLGATPVFVDIDPQTFNIDPNKLAETIKNLGAGKRPSPGSPDGLMPKGIIPVDLFGLPANYPEIEKLAENHNIFVLQDAAQSLGSSINGKKTGTFGQISATSFFPAKPLGCYGDGGAIFTDDDEVAQILESIRVHGKGSEKYDNVRIGINGRLDTIQAAILLSKLTVFPEEIEKRQNVAQFYNEGLKDLVKIPFTPEGYTSAWAQYSLVSPKKGKIITALKEMGIPTAVYYPKPLHQQSAFAHLGYTTGSFPVSEKYSGEIFSLPMHPYLNRQDQTKIIESIKKSSL